MKAEYYEIDDIKESVEKATQFWEENGRPLTKVSFQVDESSVAEVEFAGASGMQLIGISQLLHLWCRQFKKDPMQTAVMVGSIARGLSGVYEYKAEKELTIKFINKKKENEE